MAEIDTNPLIPVWPTRPSRHVDPEDRPPPEERRKKKQQQEDQNSGGSRDDDGRPHIDEYA